MLESLSAAHPEEHPDVALVLGSCEGIEGTSLLFSPQRVITNIYSSFFMCYGKEFIHIMSFNPYFPLLK